MYKFTKYNSVIRLSDGACIPFAEGNRDYAEYQEWLQEGNTPEPAQTPEEIAAEAQEAINTEARTYLASTDWYVIRYQETGVAVPEEVTTKRASARMQVA